ncbi:MAG: hypothetical protein AAFQ82_11330, partial [Myxococcota bacterium]
MGQVHQLDARRAKHEETIHWRSQRPAEDPEKTKRWGRITAKPSEYLVVMRNGVVKENANEWFPHVLRVVRRVG